MSTMLLSTGWSVGVSNLSNSQSTFNWLGFKPFHTQFTVGDNDVEIDSATVRLNAENQLNGVTASILTDNAGALGSSLGDIGFISAPVPGDNTILATQNLRLAANTTYWLRLSAPVDSRVWWIGTNQLTEVGDPGWSIGNFSYVDPIVGLGNPGMFTISATPILPAPEPSTALLAISALGGLCGVSRPRRGRFAVSR